MTDSAVGWSSSEVNDDHKRVVKVVALLSDSEPQVKGKLNRLISLFTYFVFSCSQATPRDASIMGIPETTILLNPPLWRMLVKVSLSQVTEQSECN